MRPRPAFRPDLADSVLEDRILMAVAPYQTPNLSPMVPLALTTNGYIVLSTVSFGFSSSLGVIGGAGIGGSNGLNVATNFYITGFGLSAMAIGNNTGNPNLGPVAPAGSTNGTAANLNTSVIVGSGANEAGGAAATRNPVGQSLPLSPGTGFRFIGQPIAPIVAGAPTSPSNPTGQPGAHVPVGPVAPMGPIVPVSPGQGEQPGSGAERAPSGPGTPAPTGGTPTLPGTISHLPGATPALSGTLPSLRGTLPTLSPGRSR